MSSIVGFVDERCRRSRERFWADVTRGFSAARAIRERQERARRRDDQMSMVERDAAMLLRKRAIQEIGS
jgi:hypothetical protein